MELSKARILVVDDEPDLREIFSHWLLKSGCGSVTASADGEDALALLKQKKFDLIITDIHMPKVDGLTLVRALATIAGPIPSIIMVSGYPQFSDQEMYSIGVEAFLAKPLNRDELMDVVVKTVADRSELWLYPFDVDPMQSITIHSQEGSDADREGSVLLGRGGFCASFSGPSNLGKVSFEFCIPTPPHRITGQGYVRWRSKSENTIGVEFAFLDKSSREWVLSEIKTIQPRCFIPSSPVSRPATQVIGDMDQ